MQPWTLDDWLSPIVCLLIFLITCVTSSIVQEMLRHYSTHSHMQGQLNHHPPTWLMFSPVCHLHNKEDWETMLMCHLCGDGLCVKEKLFSNWLGCRPGSFYWNSDPPLERNPDCHICACANPLLEVSFIWLLDTKSWFTYDLCHCLKKGHSK